MNRKVKKRKLKPIKKITRKMKRKLIIVVIIFFLLLLGLVARLIYINTEKGDVYTLEVLEQRDYINSSLPFKRGDILDRNYNVLATSIKEYYLILDAKMMLADDEKYLEPTLELLDECFEIDIDKIEDIIREKSTNQNIILEEFEGLEYSQVSELLDKQSDTSNYPNIRGIFVRENYTRSYPNSYLASDVVGFAGEESGTTGLELFYNQYLVGEDGREYGYVNDDNIYQTIIREASDGDTIVTTIDYNVQNIVENHIAEYMETTKPKNIGVIIADPNTGEIIAMASDKTYDLNNPRDLSLYYSEKEIEAMNDSETVDALNSMWSNYCISYTYEPGSTYKPFTISGALEEAKVSAENTYTCDGKELVGGWTINCNKLSGHGELTLEEALTYSCNDALIQIAQQEGKSNFVKYQSAFGFGKSTGIDLPSEESAQGLLFTEENMSDTDLATNSFGQNFNVTMIQMVAGFSSLINGGDYYQPHLLKQVINSEGMVEENIEKILVKKTVSAETSEYIKESLLTVVEEGTGTLASIEGYQIAGKTGTAEKQPKDEHRYLLSFIGFAPYDNPELVCYVVIDDAGISDNGNSGYAAQLFSDIMTDVLPYMGIYPE